jgi:hypothetical protein
MDPDPLDIALRKPNYRIYPIVHRSFLILSSFGVVLFHSTELVPVDVVHSFMENRPGRGRTSGSFA